jgi:hypothetical protein
MNAETFVHLVQLRLDKASFPNRGAFAEVVSRLAVLGVMDCIELAISPEGGGRLAFVLHRDDSSEAVRARLAGMVGHDAILDCRTRSF